MRYGTASDKELVEASRSGGVEAFEELARRNQGRIFSMAYHLLGNRDDALDATQDALVNAFKGIKGLEKAESFGPWLSRLAVNICRDRLREKERQRAAGFPGISLDASPAENTGAPSRGAETVQGNSPGPVKRLEQAELAAMLDAAIEDLSADYKMALVLFTRENLSHAEIAEIAGCPEETVRWRLHRARGILAEKLAGHL